MYIYIYICTKPFKMPMHAHTHTCKHALWVFVHLHWDEIYIQQIQLSYLRLDIPVCFWWYQVTSSWAMFSNDGGNSSSIMLFRVGQDFVKVALMLFFDYLRQQSLSWCFGMFSIYTTVYIHIEAYICTYEFMWIKNKLWRFRNISLHTTCCDHLVRTPFAAFHQVSSSQI